MMIYTSDARSLARSTVATKSSGSRQLRRQQARDFRLSNGQSLLDHEWLYGHDIEVDVRQT